MKTEQDENQKVISTLQGESFAMGIDEDAKNHIMEVLSKSLYSDAELAVLREYSTNALDAQIEAGYDGPIEVTLPNYLSNFLVIKDRGIGMSKEDIRDTYSQYGASSKRNTNDQVGMLGLGCKSAFAYCSQFTLVGVKDGISTQVVISRDSDGAGDMKVVDESPTTEPNGVTITIPVKSRNDFSAKAHDFFRFWAPGTVLVDGVDPHQPQTGLEITDGIWVTEGSSRKVVVMGNVPYPANIDHGLGDNYGVTAFVNIGDVAFPASREELRYTKKTKEKIEEIEKTIHKGLVASAQVEIDKCKTGYEAVKEAAKWRRMFQVEDYDQYGNRQTQRSTKFGKVNFSWKGYSPIPTYVSAKADVFDTDRITGRQMMTKDNRFTMTHHGSGTISAHQFTKQVRIEEEVQNRYYGGSTAERKVYVQNYDAAKFTVTMKKKLEHYFANDAGIGFVPYAYILVPYALTDDETRWLNHSKVYEWDDVKAVKLPRNAVASTGRVPRAFEGYDNDGNQTDNLLVPELDDDLDVYYCGPDDNLTNLGELLFEVKDDCYLFRVPNVRKNKFLRDVPRAKPVMDAIKGTFGPWFDTLSEKEQYYLRSRESSDYWVLSYVDPTKVDDPDLTLAASIAKDQEKDKKTYAEIDLKYRRYLLVESAEDMKVDAVESPLKKYPLFSVTALNLHSEHLYQYLNMVYAQSLADPAGV